MEQKTDLSREFGLPPNRKQQEFGSEFAALDPKTDPSPEFSHPPDTEFGDTYRHQEFSHDSTSSGAAKKLSRRERHRRTLLLQMAAVGLSAVVVTSSFGQDILGDDRLFSDSDHSSGSHLSQIIVDEIDEASKHDDNESLYTTSYLIYEAGNSDPGPYASSVRYDEGSNTLYLTACQVDILRINNMGDDFTIYVEDTSYVGLIECFESGLTISGSTGSSLLVNQHDMFVSWWHGIILYGGGTDAVLTISPGITVDARGGEGAIAVDNTTAPMGIRFDERYTTVSGTVQSGAFDFRDGSFVNDGAGDWTIFSNGTIAQSVRFSPTDTYDPGYDEPVQSNPPVQPVGPGLSGLSEVPRLTITDTNDTLYVIWENGNFWSATSSYEHLASYDPETNTLTIGSAPLNAIEANAMGYDFTIHVAQDVTVGTIRSTAYRDDGTVTITGENTMLTVNDSMTYEYGIYVDAAGGNSYLQVDPGVSIMTVGSRAGLAISNSWAAPGLVYDNTLTYVYEPVMVGGYGFPSNGGNYDSTQDTTVIDEKDPFQGPSTHVYIEGSHIELEPEPPAEEPPLSEYSELYVTLPGSIVPIYIVQNGQPLEDTLQIDGLSYDPESNMLILTDYIGDVISANLMGNNFTIYLQGSNKVGQISVAGRQGLGSACLTIDADTTANLVVNEDLSDTVGIWLTADNTDSQLTIDWSINLDVYGSNAAVLVAQSTAECGIAVKAASAISGDIISGNFTGSDSTDWSVSDAPGSSNIGTHTSIHRTFALEYDRSTSVGGPVDLYYENPYAGIVGYPDSRSYRIISSETTFTVSNSAAPGPLYIYFHQYTKNDTPTIVNLQDVETGEEREIDLAGEYYCPGGVCYLATDGTSLMWNFDINISAVVMPDDAFLLAPGESITFTLPDDGTDSVYWLYAESYFPDVDFTYWYYVISKFGDS